MKKLNKVYLTHCSAKKDASLKDSQKKVKPIDLYTSTPTQRFMKRCQSVGVEWAIFSDKYGIWYPSIRHEWYEKNPSTMQDEEFDKLLRNFDKSLSKFDEIWFYHNPGRFHPLYQRLIKSSSLKKRIMLITHLDDIRR